MKFLLCLVLLAGPLGFVTAQNVAKPCNVTLCDSSTCRCSSTDPPLGMAVEDIPQFVVMSFDDAVTVSNHPFYSDLAKNFKNPNGCNIRMTFFVSHENTDYTLVNDLHRHGHEVGVHSVTHKSDVENYWRNLSKAGWLAEMEDQRSMLTTYGKIPVEDIKGFRVPFLEVGGNVMYESLSEAGFSYDCSWPSLHYTPWFKEPTGEIKGALWPYTLDYASIQDETVGTKPNASFPGFWVAPMTDLQDNRGVECSMLDACQSANSEEEELQHSAKAVYDLLRRNYKPHYAKRTPFGIYVHHSWFTDYPVRKEGLSMFLNYLAKYPNVYVVTIGQLMEWVKNPVPLSKIGESEIFTCGDLPPDNCPLNNHKSCAYHKPLPISQSEVYMNICEGSCPENYPYLGNVDGEKPY